VAHSLSAKKRVRQNEKRRARNRHRKTVVRDEIKTYNAAILAGDVNKAEAELQKVVVILDKTAAKRTIHKNAAARKRSRLTRKLNALKANKAGGGTKAATA
jgi:small subunit ribosomal protein S20